MSRINTFKYVGGDLEKLEAADLRGKPATQQLALGGWRGHVWDFVASYHSVMTSAICSGALGQLTPSMTEELLTYVLP